MRRNRRVTELNLDSLVDIVSNSVGILVILAVFMSIFSLVSEPPTNPIEENPRQEVEKIIIPWSRVSQKTSLLFLIRDSRIVYFDRTPLYHRMSELANENKLGLDQEFQFDEFTAHTTIFSEQIHCLHFNPHQGAGQWWHVAQTGDGVLNRLIGQHNPSEFFFFFWVDTNSFELFRDVRQYLWENNFEVGWKPVLENSPMSQCTGITRSQSFQPQ